MPRVPYQPYSDVAPSGANVGVATPPEAFGVGVARATESLGGEVEKAGDTLFRRAVAMQQLNNETEAEQANLKLMSEAGDLHAQYNALQGEERVKAFPKYKQDLLDVQARIRSELSNDMVRRMYDRPSLNTIGHSIFNGAGAAATAQREWVGATANSTLDMAVKTIEDDPLNDVLFARKRAEIIAAAEKVAYAKNGAGPDSPITQDLVMKGISAATRQRIISVGRVDPWHAGEMLEQAVKNGDLTGPDKNAVDTSITTQRRTIGAANIANEVWDRGQQEGSSAKDMETEVRRISAERSKDPLLAEHAVHTLKSLVSTDRYIAAQEERNNKNTIMGAIATGDFKTEQELFANPRLAATRDAIKDESWKAKIPGTINSIIKAKNAVTNRQNWEELYGMMKTNPVKFRDEDITKWQLDAQDMKQFIKHQIDMKANPKEDPVVQKAIGWMRATRSADMKALGVYAPPPGDAQSNVVSNWNKFAGGIAVALDNWKEDHGGKPATQKDVVEEIAPLIFRQMTEPGKWFGNTWPNKVPFWKAGEVDYEKFKKIEDAQAEKEGRAPGTESEKQQAWMRIQYMKFFKKEKPSGQ